MVLWGAVDPSWVARKGGCGTATASRPRSRGQSRPDRLDGPKRFVPAFPLVESKLHPPAIRPGTIPRDRVMAMITADPGPAIVSLVAPPGYGKTVVLAEWAARERPRVAWLTLDDHDNDPVVFLSYLAAAIDRVKPIDGSIRSAIAAPGQRVLATAVPRLAFELHRWDRPGLLILDDMDRVVDRTCLDALTELLNHLPPRVRVAMASRMSPDLSFGRLRAQRDLLEIGRDELALDERETEALTTAAGHRLTRAAIRTLTERTEGWPAGVYLATLARDRVDTGGRSIGDVSGSDRYLAEYIGSELGLDGGGDDMTFLTRTAILETVEPGAADAIVGLTGAAERLRSLARTNLLIQEIGTSEASYRYHRLLRDFLRAELDRREPNAAQALHRRAASWYAAAGRVGPAIEHATAGGDVDTAARLVTAAALPTFYGGHGATLDRWLRGFDETVFLRHPPLTVIAGWVHLLNGRAEAADRMADIADRSTFSGTPWDGSASFESSRAMLRAVMARHGPEDVLANATIAVSQERPESPWRANALWLLGGAHLLSGDVDAADVVFAEAIGASPSSGSTVMVALAKRAGIAMARGDWRAAEGFARQSRETLAKAHFDEIAAALVVYAVGARVAIHRGDVIGAHAELTRAQLVRPMASYGLPWFSVDALLELGRAYLALSDPAGARSVVREAEEIARRRPGLGTLDADLAALRRQLTEAATELAGSSTLTSAELRLLPILPTYLSFQEIADRLFISRNTVKTQALSIYGKLHASSRGEAVERAIELGLLEPYPGLEPTGSTSAH